MFAEWPCPLPGGTTGTENARIFEKGRDHRLLVIPPLFDEHNKMRHQLVEVMRRLDLTGIDSVMPDQPGWNESKASLADQSLDGWREAMKAAVQHFKPTRYFAVRAGALLVPVGLPGWDYAPTGGKQVLRGMVRARIIAAKEAGREETTDALMRLGRSEGVELAGWKLGASMVSQLEAAEVAESPLRRKIDQATVGGKPLWLRAEPDDDPEQADALAAIIAVSLDSAGGAG
ncbi:hypothetical protein [Erythrobacter litoralis]|uniref:Uncharacterized protein n=1 Tax=Erythrobacter litoralis (strain HTCC2594) TaxID=314225 RepID=Q2NA22_ERYLH|nr:hypothetical protein [Erythrobacter litoralis]ABC63469.1 hypothetical protein ELI_06885 [Erythrobacter litoralis HTCC2594]